MSEPLESYGTNRADFRNIDKNQRTAIKNILTIARSQVDAPNAPDNLNSGRYGRSLRKKKNRFFYLCGQAGISQSESQAIWWSFVYDDAPPIDRIKLV